MDFSLRDYRSDIELIAQRLKLSRDNKLERRQIDMWIAKYRARGIREEYARNEMIDSAWLQDMGVMDVTVVNSGDDPQVASASRKFGKVTLPALVSFQNRTGVYRMAKPSNMTQYFPADWNYLLGLQAGTATDKFDYFALVGRAAYITPCTDTVRPILILADPMEGYVIQTEFVAQDDLTVGESYTVYATQVVHNAVAYNPGNTFTAVATTYSGNGKVKFTNGKRRMRDTDPYPMGLTLAYFVTEMIFVREFRLTKEQLADAIDNGRDETLILQSGETIRRARESKESPAAGQ